MNRLVRLLDWFYASSDEITRVVMGIGLLLVGLGLVLFVHWLM
jgi:hypothetical protein